MSASVPTHQVIQLSGFPIFRRVTHLMGKPRFAFAKSHAPPSPSSRRSVARPALAYGFPSRWLSGEGFFQPSGSADMPGAQNRRRESLFALHFAELQFGSLMQLMPRLEPNSRQGSVLLPLPLSQGQQRAQIVIITPGNGLLHRRTLSEIVCSSGQQAPLVAQLRMGKKRI